MNQQAFLSQRPVAFSMAMAAVATGFIEYGQELRLIRDNQAEEESINLRDKLPDGLLFRAEAGKISVMPGHHRANMDDDTTQEWGDNGPALSCDFLYYPPRDAASEKLKPLELWAEVEGDLICIERLEWVEDCLRFVDKPDLGYFGDITISGKSVEQLAA